MRTLGIHSPMSHAALERVLKSFGFTKTVYKEEGTLIFRHPPTRAMLVLSSGTPQEKVHQLDLITVRRTVLEKGIATLDEYNQGVQLALAPVTGLASKNPSGSPDVVERRQVRIRRSKPVIRRKKAVFADQ
jgi:hypothetical protein